MFEISFKNVGEDMITRDIMFDCFGEDEALNRANDLCNEMLEARPYNILRSADNEYLVLDGCVVLGSFILQNVRG